MLVDDRGTQPQANAGALQFLRSEKSVEDLFTIFFRDAHTRRMKAFGGPILPYQAKNVQLGLL